MTESVKIKLASHPDLNVRMKLKPLGFEAAGEASLAIATGDIHFHVDEIPFAQRIPFLNRRVVVSSYGPFGVRIRPFEGVVRVHGLGVRGVVGGEEAGADFHTQGACKAEIDITGEAVEQAVSAVVKKLAEE